MRETFALQRGLRLLLALTRPQSQSNARYRLDIFRTRPVVTELAPEPVECHADNLARGRIAVAPDRASQGLGRDHGFAVSHKAFDHPELGAGQTERLAVDGEKPLAKIEPQATHREDRLARRTAIKVGMTNVCSDPC